MSCEFVFAFVSCGALQPLRFDDPKIAPIIRQSFIDAGFDVTEVFPVWS